MVIEHEKVKSNIMIEYYCPTHNIKLKEKGDLLICKKCNKKIFYKLVLKEYERYDFL